MTSPQLTIVIPVYNRAAIVRRTLDSVAAQTTRPLCVVLVDNNSTDSTPEVLRQWRDEVSAPDFSVEIISETRPGACCARNAGLARVTTPWVMFFDSDDVMLPGHTARALRVAASEPAPDIVGWDMLIINRGRGVRMPFIVRDTLYNNIMHSSFSTIRYMARTALVRRAGGWLEGARVFDDCELGVRLLMLNPAVIYAGRDITVHVYDTEESITQKHDGRLAAMDVAMSAIRRNLPEDCKHWADLERMIMATTWARHDKGAKELTDSIILSRPRRSRPLWRLLRAYSLAGGRGVARIYRLLTAGKL